MIPPIAPICRGPPRFFRILPSGVCRWPDAEKARPPTSRHTDNLNLGENAMTWTPLIEASAFTGIQTDVLTVAGGVLTIGLSILGIGILWKLFSH
jgi:uncharacterized iron-regulated membrane protein